ncbi:uncharacterized protein RAG0_06385 [Rhynchosporium agropyri]|uniref:Uncharacterized protein n=1 Tax=Rhynchosporium agropyri TaxID=914238 RepID=A0A1E1KGU9_9HELO|nr:uncharacterized protein RAG0_06385 [Rhynchosporium agropyri]
MTPNLSKVRCDDDFQIAVNFENSADSSYPFRNSVAASTCPSKQFYKGLNSTYNLIDGWTLPHSRNWSSELPTKLTRSVVTRKGLLTGVLMFSGFAKRGSDKPYDLLPSIY